MPKWRSIFNNIPEKPKFEIKKTCTGEKSVPDREVNFNVTFNISTVNNDYEAHAQKFSQGPVNHVNFKIADVDKLIIDVTFKQLFSAESDLEFRNAIGLASRYNLQSTEITAILEDYEGFLKANGFNAPQVQNQNGFTCN